MSSTGTAQRDAWTNGALGALLALATASGLAAFAVGTPLVGRWVVLGHGAAGIGLLLLARRKGRIVRRSLGRPRRRPGTPASLLLAALVATTVLTGLVHASGGADRVGPLTLMQVHVGAAVLAVPLAVHHYRRRPRRTLTGSAAPGVRRRAVLRGAAVSAASAASLAGWEGGLAVADAPGERRRFTGSHEVGSGDPTAFPVTQWFDDRVQEPDAGTWRLDTGAGLLTLADLRALPQDDHPAAVLDCTGGWWSQQQWRGVRLDRLVDPGGAASVRVRSATGYTRLLPPADVQRTWLALQCGGQPLSAGHGSPARLVAPGRRGFWWVKWVVAVEPSSLPWWAQSPFPLP